jgi:hypothetical protein
MPPLREPLLICICRQINKAHPSLGLFSSIKAIMGLELNKHISPGGRRFPGNEISRAQKACAVLLSCATPPCMDGHVQWKVVLW